MTYKVGFYPGNIVQHARRTD